MKPIMGVAWRFIFFVCFWVGVGGVEGVNTGVCLILVCRLGFLYRVGGVTGKRGGRLEGKVRLLTVRVLCERLEVGGAYKRRQ